MAYNRTVGQLTASVRARGDYDNNSDGTDAYISDSFLMDQVSAGYKEAYELLAEADPDRLTTTSLYTIGTTTGSFPLPDDMYRLRAIDVKSGDQWYRVLRDDPSPINSPWELPGGATIVGILGLSARYRLEGSYAYVAPNMSAGTIMRTTYIPAPVSLSSSLQAIDGTAGTDEYTVSYALRECRIREDKEFSAVERKLEQSKQRIKNMGRDRDAGQAKRLADPLRGGRGRGFRR